MVRMLMFFLVLVICAELMAQSRMPVTSMVEADSSRLVLTGDGETLPDAMGENVLMNRQLILARLQDNLEGTVQDEIFAQNAPQKSVGKAVLFSAILPGTGQLYAGSYWKSALFLAVEAAAWAINISYNKKGDDQTDFFQSFADQNWSEQRYWTFVYLQLNGRGIEGFPSGKYDNQFGTDATGREVILNWEEAERDLEPYANTQFISGFSHHLPETKTQQYYEMIGKYPEQFGNAWADASYNVRYEGSYGGVKAGNITPMIGNYVSLRDEANRLYDRAAYGSMIALVNHVISAVDAGFTTNRYNRRQLRLSYQSRWMADKYVNLVGLTMTF